MHNIYLSILFKNFLTEIRRKKKKSQCSKEERNHYLFWQQSFHSKINDDHTAMVTKVSVNSSEDYEGEIRVTSRFFISGMSNSTGAGGASESEGE